MICHLFTEERLDLNCLLMKLRGNVDPKLWYQFGMAIGVPEDVLEKLKGYDEEQCMIELADYWLRNHPTKPTWSKIYDTAKSLMKPMKFVNHYAVTQDLSGINSSFKCAYGHYYQHTGSKMRDACPQDSIILNYTAVIPKSIRSRLQRSVSPPPVPPRMDQLH